MGSKRSRFLGGILLVAGTAIGAGMLALPVVTSFCGFFPSILVFLLCWTLMLLSAYFFLEVNLAIRGEPNLVSMAGKTLGSFGKWMSWVFYLLLLYALLAAYMAGCAPLFASLFDHIFHVAFPDWFLPFILPLLFGGFIYLGTLGVDYLNRFLMVGLVFSYLLLVGGSPPFIESSHLDHVDYLAGIVAVPILITSFGYHIIIPTLSTYLQHDRKSLCQVIFIGSLIPFVIYLLWQWIVMGSVPMEALLGAWKKGVPATEPLSQYVAVPWIGAGAKFFSFFAIVTSFLGVSLSLSDFLRDGLRLKRSWKGRVLAIFLTFIPPLIFIFTCEKSFYLALNYAGAFVAILLGILPSLMVLKLKKHPIYNRFYVKSFVWVVIVLYLGVVVIDFLSKQGLLDFLTDRYLQ